MNKSAKNQSLGQDAGYPLITRERTDKLDLLQHLTANLARAVIVIGPEGVGKTRLLNLFKDALKGSTITCAINGANLLTLENIQEQINAAIAQTTPDLKPQSLPETLGQLSRQNIQVVVLIDDAGYLAPGLMEQIVLFAGENPTLRIIFALTHNELYLKNSTDTVVDDCYQIEIPPLTELQCADFLEYLSTLPNPRIDFSAINETMVADLYRETYGIPGKILGKLPKPRNAIKLDYSAAILTCAVTGLIAIALGVQWWSSRPKPKMQVVAENKVNPQSATTTQQVGAVTDQLTQQVDASTSSNVKKGNDGVDSQTNAAANQNAKAQAPAGKVDSTVQGAQSVQPPAATMAVQPTVANTAITSTQASQVLDEGGQWVMKQPAENFTLQLMALDDKATILEVMQRHQALGQNLRYLKTTTRRGKDRFVLLYGSFASPDQASAEAKKLPVELRKSWQRKMNSVQAELQVSLPTPPPSAPTASVKSP